MRIADDESCEFEDIRWDKETDKALHCFIGGKPFWIPKSQIEDYEVGSYFRFSRLCVRRWWAEKSGALAAYEDAHVWDHPPPPPPKEQPSPEPPPVVYEFMTDINQLWQAVKENARRGLVPESPIATAVYRKLAVKYHPDRS